MRKILVIGVGAGNPDYITIQAIKALNQVDVFFLFDKGGEKDELIQLRKELLETYIEGHDYRMVAALDPARDREAADYEGAVQDWHDKRADAFAELFANELGPDECGAFLAWGDPALYDSTLRVIDRIIDRAIIAFQYEVIPGITSIQSLTAGHRIPLNGIGEPIHITTGRRLAEGKTGDAENVVIMLDAHLVARRHPDAHIYWGAYLGTSDEVLIEGRVGDVIEQIETRRAALRESKGWIMDTYLLRMARSADQ